MAGPVAPAVCRALKAGNGLPLHAVAPRQQGSGIWLAGSFHLTAIVPLHPSRRCGWVTVFSSVVLAFFLLTIEEIGVVSGWAAAVTCYTERAELRQLYGQGRCGGLC